MTLPEGTRVKTKPACGLKKSITGRVVGVMNTGLPLLGIGYMIQADKREDVASSTYDYGVIGVFEAHFDVLENQKWPRELDFLNKRINYLALDNDGSWWGFSERPLFNKTHIIWTNVDGSCRLIPSNLYVHLPDCIPSESLIERNPE